MKSFNLSPVLSSRVEHWPLHRLKPYERNARQHSESQIQQIARSIACKVAGCYRTLGIDAGPEPGGIGINAGHPERRQRLAFCSGESVHGLGERPFSGRKQSWWTKHLRWKSNA